MKSIFYTFPNNPPSETILSGKSIYLYTNKNKKYLDLTSGSTHNCILGYNNKYVISEINKQLKLISNIDSKTWIDSNLIKLSDLIINQTNKSLDRVFYTGQSGSEACEAAMQLSFQTHFEKGKKDKKYFISTKESYHGSTINSLAAGDRPFTKYMKSILPKNHIKINEHDPIRKINKKQSKKEYLNNCLNEIKNKINIYGDSNIAALIGEPILGGLQGDIPPLKEYWKSVYNICKKHDIHLILDEVYSGTGISGKYCCSQWDNITPDFIVIGKTLAAGYIPLSAVITKKSFENIIKKGSGRVSYSTTHQSHSLGVAAALAVQSFIRENELIKNSNKLGNFMMKTLINELKDDDCFFSVHGRGLRFSLQYRTNNNEKFGLLFKRKLKEKHSILIDSKFHRIGFRPQMILKIKKSEEILDKIIKTFKEVKNFI